MSDELAGVERRLGSSEAAFWFGDLVMPTTVVIFAEVTGAIDVEDLRRALPLLCARHPRLAGRIVPDPDGHPVFREGGQPLPLRVVDDGDCTSEVNRELATRFDYTASLVRCTLVRTAEGRASVLFALTHALADGVSATQIVCDLLRCLDGVRGGASTALAPVPPAVSFEALLAEKPGWLRSAIGIVRLFMRVLRHGLPHQIPRARAVPAAERVTHAHVETFDAPLVEALVARAREEKTTLNGALCAAMSIAVAEAREQDGVVIDCIAPLNMRPAARVGSDAIGMFVTSVPMVFKVRRDDDLWAVARRATASFAEGVQRGEPVVVLSYVGALARVLARLSRKPDGPARIARFVEALGTPTFALSNMGSLDVERRYGRITLESIGLVGGLGCANYFGSVVATLAGRMQWSFTWVSPSIADELAIGIVRRARAHLTRAGSKATS